MKIGVDLMIFTPKISLVFCQKIDDGCGIGTAGLDLDVQVRHFERKDSENGGWLVGDGHQLPAIRYLKILQFFPGRFKARIDLQGLFKTGPGLRFITLRHVGVAQTIVGIEGIRV